MLVNLSLWGRKKIPVFDASSRLHHFLLDSNISSTAFSDFVKIYKRSSANELKLVTKNKKKGFILLESDHKHCLYMKFPKYQKMNIFFFFQRTKQENIIFHCIRNIASTKTNKLSWKYADIDICEHTFDKPPKNSANEKSDLWLISWSFKYPLPVSLYSGLE